MRTQINLKLDKVDLEAIDAAVRRRNETADAGAPDWTRTSYMLASTLATAESEKRAIGANG